MFEAMNRAIAQNRITPVIDKAFEFDDAVNALRMLKAGEHFGKIVITIP